MKKQFLLIIVIFLCLSMTTCEFTGLGSKTFEHYLIGTWESEDGSVYNGTLEIGFNWIIITGYTENQSLPLGHDNDRPFKNISKGETLTAYSDTGRIFINDFGWQPSIAYEINQARTRLRFTFGGRVESLVRQVSN